MAHSIDERLAKLGVTLPDAPTPAANYLPYIITGNQVLIAGQAAVVDGKHKFVGRLGAEVSVAEGKEAARLAAINVLAQVKAACNGDWNKLARCLRICGYLNATPEFADHPQVLDGASDFLVSVLGDAGKHVRSVLGASSLRSRTALVIDAVFEIKV
ncbi:MAG: RidA family protein, partial [Burkholderiales bacterium]